MARIVTLEEVLEKFKEVHGDRYDYSKFVYKSRVSKGTIICKEHGKFEQTFNHHYVTKSGCPTCAGVPIGGFKTKSYEQFLQEMKNIFKDELDFSKFIYKNNSTNGIIVCPIHGESVKTPKKLLKGQGCAFCSGKRKHTTESFKDKVNNIYGEGTYDLSKCNYISNKVQVNLICPIHGDWFVRPDNLWAGQNCPKCAAGNPKTENEIRAFIQSLGLETIDNDRSIIYDTDQKYEIDIYIPSKQIAIEFCGLYWHSELTGGKTKNYHLTKHKLCEEKDIQLITIFEDEWKFKKPIVQSVLKSKLGKIDHSIYARNCKIKEVESHEKHRFLTENHLQGTDKSSIKLGLYHNDILVSIMTFGKSRFNKNYEWEIVRFCSALNINVIGGFSRLLKYFISNYNPISIITYADKRYSNGNTYRINQLTATEKDSSPNYWYFKKRELQRYSRNKFQKHMLPSILPFFDDNQNELYNMQNNGYDRIWDCGNKVFTWKK